MKRELAAVAAVFERTVQMAARAKDDEGLVEMAISSEAPYERWFGIEVLRHSADAVDLARIGDGRHPLLLNHDVRQQAGVIKKAWIDDEQKMLRGAAKFSRSAFGKEIEQDVADGIRSLVSVGYEILELEEVDTDPSSGEERTVRRMTGEQFVQEMRAKYGESFYRAGPAAARGNDSKVPTFVVTKWRPFEASLVAIPADTSVGVGRSTVVDGDPAQQGRQQQQQQKKPPQPQREQITVEQNQKDPAQLEGERRDAILTLGEQYGRYVTQKDVADALRNGRSVEQFKDLIMEKMQTKHTSTIDAALDLSAREIKRYSFGRALVAAVSGDWSKAGFERECSEALSKIMGRSPEGFYVPLEAWHRDFNVGTTTEAGNLVPTVLRTDMYVDALRNAMVLARMGVRILPGLTANVDLPRKSTAGTLGMLTEIGSASETNPLTAKVTLSPKRIGAFVEVSKQALIQSAIALEGMLRDDLLVGAGVLLDNQALNGNGTSPNILGIRNTTGVGTTTAGANGAAPAWAHFVDLESACANSNAEPDTLAGYLVNTRTRGKAKQTQKGTNLPFIWDNGPQPLNGYRALVTNNLPNNLTKGTSTTICSAGLFSSDWSMGVIGLFGAPDVTVDPFTKADTGQVKITLNQFADFGARQPAAFSKIEDWLAN